MNPIPLQGSVQWLEVDAEDAGQRIDNFLFSRLKGVPKSHIYRILRTGEVRRNGGRVRAQERIDRGDTIRLPPLRLAAREPDLDPGPRELVTLQSRILFEDAELLILDKPAGMAVHGGSGVRYGVIEGLRRLRPEIRALELVHRLDRDTSGCLLLAKKRSALRALHEQFRGDAVEKTYLALLSGAWARSAWIVDAPLRKNVLQSGERVVKVSGDGKPARTEFRRVRLFRDATLVEARPLTGRTHQIRVHARHLRHPIAGDERYGEPEANRDFRRLGLRRLFLHAARTGFHHPRSGEWISAEAPLATELAAFLEILAA